MLPKLCHLDNDLVNGNDIHYTVYILRSTHDLCTYTYLNLISIQIHQHVRRRLPPHQPAGLVPP